MKGAIMANSRYTTLDPGAATVHDEKLLAAQNALLDKIATTTVAAAVRNYAEAYALLRGFVSATSVTEIKNG